MEQNRNTIYCRLIFILFLLPHLVVVKGQILMSQRNNVRDSLQLLVDGYWENKQYDKSIEELYKIIDLYKDINGGKTSYHMKANINVGICLKALGRYDEAVDFFEKAYSIWNNVIRIPDNNLLYMARECAECYRLKGSYDDAIRWGNIVVEQERIIMAGRITDEYIDDLCNLGMSYFYNNNFSLAKDYLALTISSYRTQGTLKDNMLSVIANTMLIAKCMYELEDLDKSEELYLLVDSVCEGSKEYNKYRIYTHNMLGVIASQRNDDELALKRFDEAETLYNEFCDSLNDSESQIILPILSSKAALNMYDNPEISCNIYNDLLTYYESEGKTSDEMYSICLSNQACCYILMNKPQLALETINKAFANINVNKYYGQQIYLSLMSTKMLCLVACKDAKLIESGADEMSNYIGCQLYENFPYLTEEERSTYWEKVSGWYSRLLPTMTLIAPTDKMAELCYNGVLQSKGILLNSTINIDRMLKQSDNEELLALQKQRQDCMEKLQEAVNENDEYSIDYMSHLVKQLEKRILKEIVSVGNFMDDLRIDVDSIKANLRKDELAVEFLRSTNIDDTDTTYLALTIMNDYEHPHIIKLPDNSVIKSLADMFVSDANTSEIYNRIWQPIFDDCGKNKPRTIFFAADGLIYNLPIEYCSVPGGNTFFEDYECYRVSSTRFLTKRKRNNKKKGIVALYGDIDYNAGIDDVKQSDMKLQSELDIDKSGNINYFASREANLLIERGSIGFDSLKGTRDEIKEIASIFNSHKVNPLIMDSYKASKKSVELLAEKDLRVLHLATHGFYVNRIEKQRYGYLNFIFNDKISSEQESMSRSALVMAGANKYMKEALLDGSSVSADGFLTAYDISLLDLNGLDMAVLSACESGLGDIDSEGVFGLQRGFKKAGARSLLMSLVKVNDHATMLFMKEFYRSYLSGKHSKRVSLIDAQKYLRTAENGRWNKPEYWASFILLDGM